MDIAEWLKGPRPVAVRSGVCRQRYRRPGPERAYRRGFGCNRGYLGRASAAACVGYCLAAGCHPTSLSSHRISRSSRSGTAPADRDVLRSRRVYRAGLALRSEDLRDVVASYHRAVAETVSRFAGFVAKYMGDGVHLLHRPCREGGGAGCGAKAGAFFDAQSMRGGAMLHEGSAADAIAAIRRGIATRQQLPNANQLGRPSWRFWPKHVEVRWPAPARSSTRL